LDILLVEQAVVHPAAIIYECERNSADFELDEAFWVGLGNTQCILEVYCHKDQSDLD
jgi:hypothetical protein